jgi:hypothetical protein
MDKKIIEAKKDKKKPQIGQKVTKQLLGTNRSKQQWSLPSSILA